MDESMRNVVLMFVGIGLIGGVVALLDWLARRKDRQSQHHPPA
jgi:sensor c-di-GMP phosphodiesterase-like protein